MEMKYVTYSIHINLHNTIARSPEIHKQNNLLDVNIMFYSQDCEIDKVDIQ